VTCQSLCFISLGLTSSKAPSIQDRYLTDGSVWLKGANAQLWAGGVRCAAIGTVNKQYPTAVELQSGKLLTTDFWGRDVFLSLDGADIKLQYYLFRV
jgi:hypothetical protein